jgi:hypothetical protein
MQAMPRSSLEVIEPEFFLQLLVRLLTDPARLNGSGDTAIGVSTGKLER